MIRKRLLNKLFVSIIALTIVFAGNTIFHWSDLLWWFDMPMHFLGGFTVFFFCAIVWLPARKWVSNGRFLFEAVITTVLIGVLWEALELYLYLTYGSPGFITLDAISDVFFDLAGALFAGYKVIPLLKMDPESSSG